MMTSTERAFYPCCFKHLFVCHMSSHMAETTFVLVGDNLEVFICKFFNVLFCLLVSTIFKYENLEPFGVKVLHKP